MVAHLRRDPGLLRDAGDEARLTDVVGERLLAVDVLAGLHRQDRDVRVQVVGRGDEDGVDGLLLLEHDPEVFVHRARVSWASCRRSAFRPPPSPARGPTCRCSTTCERSHSSAGSASAMIWQSSSWKRARALVRPCPPAPMIATFTLSLGATKRGAAQDVPGHDGERGRGGGGRRDELSAGRGRLRVHGRPFPARGRTGRIIEH